MTRVDHPISISVIMPTYNTDINMLKSSVESILGQTFRDFEFIIMDDGTTNGSEEYLKSLTDDRIRIITNPQNIGITKSLNIGLGEARGKYIARMDADDISLPERFEEQFNYMENHPEAVMCGSWGEDFGQTSILRKTYISDMDHYRIKMFFYYPGPMHPTMFIRHDTLSKYKIAYDERLRYAQDYALCVALANHGVIKVLPKVLLRRRIHQKRISDEHYKTQKQCSMMTQKRLLVDLLGDVTDEEVSLHYKYSYEKHFSGIADACRCFYWYLKLVHANNRAGKYPKRKFISYACKLFILITAQSLMPIGTSMIISIKNRITITKADNTILHK